VIPALAMRRGFVINRGSLCTYLGLAELSRLSERVENWYDVTPFL
jgi:hypothetical protein